MATLKSIYTPPTKASSDQEWMKWYDEIQGFGKKKADLAFTRAWSVRGADKANTATLRDYMQSKGIHISGGTVSDLIDDKRRLFDSFTDFFKMGAIGTTALMVVIIVVVLIIVYKNLSNPQTTAAIAGAGAKAMI